jgi:FkbM family methyltransferase
MFGFLKRGDRARETAALDIDGLHLEFFDHPSSVTRQLVIQEFVEDAYKLKEIDFQPGDIVVDVGGHVGIFSIFVAKRYPFVKVIAFEPVPPNVEYFRRNLAHNQVNNVELFPMAITRDGRDVQLAGRLEKNSGGASAVTREISSKHERWTIQSRTLTSVFDEFDIQKCKLLKIDCEGAEHEILFDFPYLARVDYMRGEFHINGLLRSQGYSIDRLAEHCRKFIEPNRLSYVSCTMAD